MNYDNTTNDHTLIAQILKGDTNAFASFVAKYQRLVSYMVYRMVTNIADREDLIQDIFIKVYRNLSSFRFECKVSTWIARIAYNTCINYLQKLKTPLYEDFCQEHKSIAQISSQAQQPDAYIEGKDLSARVQTEINKMDVRYKTILTLYHLEEMSYSEIGKIMNLPEGTVKSYLFRARRQLKDRLISKYRKEELCHANT